MRIIGYIEHPRLKITLFKMNNKFSAKFEIGLYEQTYKFREGTKLTDLNDLKKILDPSFIAAVEKEFKRMQQMKHLAIERFLLSQDADNEFDDIV